MFLCKRLRRRRRDEVRTVEDGLRMLGESFAAPEDVKRAGLERLLEEFERSRAPKR
jgi:hypothetical protein